MTNYFKAECLKKRCALGGNEKPNKSKQKRREEEENANKLK